MERIIDGKIAKWGDVKSGFKKDNVTTYCKISCQIEGSSDWHSFFSPDGTPVPLQQMMLEFPLGSSVTFVEWKKADTDPFWNYKTGSLKAIEALPESPIQASEQVLDTQPVQTATAPMQKATVDANQYKTADADKYSFGMAVNIVGGMMANKSMDEATYKDKVSNVYTWIKALRIQHLGY